MTSDPHIAAGPADSLRLEVSTPAIDHAYTAVLDVIRALRRPLQYLDADAEYLAEELRKALTRVAMELRRACHETDRDVRRNHCQEALAKASRAHAALHVAEAAGHLSAPMLQEPMELVDLLEAMLEKLVGRRSARL